MTSLAPLFEAYKIEPRRSLGVIRHPEDIAAVFAPMIGRIDREVFMVGLVNARLTLFATELISIGSLDSTLVHPREVFKPAIIKSAWGIILVHNHPSGDTTISHDDLQITRNMIKAGQILKIPVIDHLIIGNMAFRSIRWEHPNEGWDQFESAIYTVDTPAATS